MRIDRLLCNLRFLRTRTLAADLVRSGHLRRNGVRVTRPSQEVAIGDVHHPARPIIRWSNARLQRAWPCPEPRLLPGLDLV